MVLRNDLFHASKHEVSELWTYDELQAALDIIEAVETAESYARAEREAARPQR